MRSQTYIHDQPWHDRTMRRIKPPPFSVVMRQMHPGSRYVTPIGVLLPVVFMRTTRRPFTHFPRPPPSRESESSALDAHPRVSRGIFTARAAVLLLPRLFVHRWAQRPCWVLVISCPSSSSPPSVALSGVSLVQISSVQISVVPRKSNRGATSICRRCSPQLEPKGKSGRGLGLTGEGGGGRWISSMEDSPTPDEASDRGCSAGGWRQISQITLGGSCCRAML